MNFLSEIRSRFLQALGGMTDAPADYLEMIRPAQDPRHGDFQANCAMPLAKRRGANPREVAAEIVSRLDVADLCEEPQIAGPGFINLRIKTARLEEESGRLVDDGRLGVPAAENPRKIVIDFSSPNVAKPMHVGHLRSTVIGDALGRLLRFQGHAVVKDNHVGDWGTQFGMIIYGYKHFLDEENFRAEPVGELARLYRLVNRLAEYHDAVAALPGLEARLAEQQSALEQVELEGDPQDKKAKKALRRQRTELEELKTQIRAYRALQAEVESDAELKKLADAHPEIARAAREETAKLHAGDEENLRLWKRFVPECLQAIQSVYDRLGIEFDMTLGESFYQPMLADVVEDLLKREKIAKVSQGAVCVFVEGFEAPFIIRKSDGAYTYATTDLATVRYRVNELQAEAILYVVDARQSEHFRLLFETARKWGYADVEFRHVSFGTVLGKDKRPFKTRAGDTVGLESLLDEAVRRARAIVDENDDAKETPELDEPSRAAVAEIVGLGGIKYADLRHNRDSDYVFSWEKMLSKTGDTATYIQYSYARICGIFRKGNVDRESLRESGAVIILSQPEERSLALQLNRFSQEIESAGRELRPNFLTQYLFETANSFSTFYEKCPVLKEEMRQVENVEIRNSRLLLCDLTGRVLEQGLALLGIGTCPQM